MLTDLSVAVHDVAGSLGATSVEGDVADPDHWDKVAQVAGEATIVHLNAGVLGELAPVDQVAVDDYRRTTRANIDGVFLGLRAMVPVLEANGGGDVIATASLAGLMPFEFNPVYTMTKHAVVGLVRSSAPGLAARGIKINAVCPGIVDTPMASVAADMGREVRLIPVRDIADAVLGCIADDGTGQCWSCVPDQPPTRWVFSGPSKLGPSEGANLVR